MLGEQLASQYGLLRRFRPAQSWRTRGMGMVWVASPQWLVQPGSHQESPGGQWARHVMWQSRADAGAHKLLRTGRWVTSHSIHYHSTQSCPSRPNNKILLLLLSARIGLLCTLLSILRHQCLNPLILMAGRASNSRAETCVQESCPSGASAATRGLPVPEWATCRAEL